MARIAAVSLIRGVAAQVRVGPSGAVVGTLHVWRVVHPGDGVVLDGPLRLLGHVGKRMSSRRVLDKVGSKSCYLGRSERSSALEYAGAGAGVHSHIFALGIDIDGACESVARAVGLLF